MGSIARHGIVAERSGGLAKAGLPTGSRKRTAYHCAPRLDMLPCWLLPAGEERVRAAHALEPTSDSWRPRVNRPAECNLGMDNILMPSIGLESPCMRR
jgi:hypothetical protein